MTQTPAPRSALGLLAFVLAACGGEETPGCVPVGAEGAPPAVLGLVENDTRGGLVPLSDGGEVHLWRPLQGGHVLYVGARVTGLCTDAVMVTGRILDPQTGEALSQETRRGFGLVDAGDGTATSPPDDLGAVANVALCPPPVDGLDVHGRAFRLEVEVSDADGRVARGALTVTPTCGQADELDRRACVCECTTPAPGRECD